MSFIQPAERLHLLPAQLFARLVAATGKLQAAGHDVINLGQGNPDLPTPPRIVSVLQEAAADPANHRYPSYFGLTELREAIAGWYRQRFDVGLDGPQVQPGLGAPSAGAAESDGPAG